MSKKNIFDLYAKSYKAITQKKLSFFNKKRDYFDLYKINIIKKKIQSPKNIIDYGCGIGLLTNHLIKFFPDSNIYATDNSKVSLKILKKKYKKIKIIDYYKIKKNFFDLSILTGVIHHIPSKYISYNLKKIRNIINDYGKIIIFEHNPYNFITQNIVNNCPYDEGVQLIKKKKLIEIASSVNLRTIDSGYCLFFPEFLKKLRFLEKYLKWCPLGGQYYLVLKKH